MTYRIIFGILLFIIVVFNAYLFMCKIFDLDILIKIIIADVASIGLMFNYYQLKSNLIWNQKHSAMIELDKGHIRYIKATKSLNNNLKYREKEEAYSVKEIHNFICKKDGDKLKNDDDGFYILSKEGQKIKHNIFIILNYYEYLAVGVKNKIFDENTIKSLIRGSLIKSNKVFGEYIDHLREKHTKNKNQFIEMQKLAKKWS